MIKIDMMKINMIMMNLILHQKKVKLINLIKIFYTLFQKKLLKIQMNNMKIWISKKVDKN